MVVTFVPQYDPYKKVSYSVEGETISVTVDKLDGSSESDVFDFSDFGEDDLFEGVETTLSVNPVVFADRVNGVMHVTVIRWYSSNDFAPTEEVIDYYGEDN